MACTSAASYVCARSSPRCTWGVLDHVRTHRLEPLYPRSCDAPALTACRRAAPVSSPPAAGAAPPRRPAPLPRRSCGRAAMRACSLRGCADSSPRHPGPCHATPQHRNTLQSGVIRYQHENRSRLTARRSVLEAWRLQGTAEPVAPWAPRAAVDRADMA